MTKKRPSIPKTRPAPSKFPNDPEQLLRAITLLGARWQGDLRASRREQLVDLVGDYPTQDEALVWKQFLKAARAQLLKGTP